MAFACRNELGLPGVTPRAETTRGDVRRGLKVMGPVAAGADQRGRMEAAVSLGHLRVTRGAGRDLLLRIRRMRHMAGRAGVGRVLHACPFVARRTGSVSDRLGRVRCVAARAIGVRRDGCRAQRGLPAMAAHAGLEGGRRLCVRLVAVDAGAMIRRVRAGRLGVAARACIQGFAREGVGGMAVAATLAASVHRMRLRALMLVARLTVGRDTRRLSVRPMAPGAVGLRVAVRDGRELTAGAALRLHVTLHASGRSHPGLEGVAPKAVLVARRAVCARALRYVAPFSAAGAVRLLLVAPVVAVLAHDLLAAPVGGVSEARSELCPGMAMIDPRGQGAATLDEERAQCARRPPARGGTR